MKFLKKKCTVEVRIVVNKQIFYPGEEVIGYAEVETKENIHMTCLEACILGREVVSFTNEKHNTVRDEKTIHKEQIILSNPPKSESPSLIPSTNNNEPPYGEIVHAGKYQYPFYFKIPEWAPASVSMKTNQSLNGTIEWGVHVLFQGKPVDAKITDNLYSIQVDQNIIVKKIWVNDHIIPEPVGFDSINHKMKFAKGTFSFSITVERKVLIKGQDAKITVKMNNDSSRKIREVIVYLQQETEGRAKDETRTIKVSRIGQRTYKEGCCAPGTQKEFDILFPVPKDIETSVIYGGKEVIVDDAKAKSVCPWNKDGELFGIKYSLKFRFKIALTADPIAKVPVFIFDSDELDEKEEGEVEIVKSIKIPVKNNSMRLTKKRLHERIPSGTLLKKATTKEVSSLLSKSDPL